MSDKREHERVVGVDTGDGESKQVRKVRKVYHVQELLEHIREAEKGLKNLAEARLVAEALRQSVSALVEKNETLASNAMRAREALETVKVEKRVTENVLRAVQEELMAQAALLKHRLTPWWVRLWRRMRGHEESR